MPKRKTTKKKKASKRAAKSTTVTTMTTTKTTRTTMMKNPPKIDQAKADQLRIFIERTTDPDLVELRDASNARASNLLRTLKFATGLTELRAESAWNMYGPLIDKAYARYPEVTMNKATKIKVAQDLAQATQRTGRDPNPLRLGKQDKAVIRAFTERRTLDGHKLTTNGTKLEGYWMGGNDLAHWRDGKIHLPDTGSRSGQTVQNAVRREAPKNDLFNGRGWNPQSKERRAFLAAQRRMRGDTPRPKFKIGDMVEDVDGTREGEVDFVGSYDAFLGGYQYKVLEADGTRNYWNETSMRKVSRNPGHDHMACGDLSQKRCDQLNDVYESSRKRYGKKRSAQIARGVVREQVARDKRKRSRRHNPQWIRVPSAWLRPGMIVKAPKTVGHLTWKRAWGPGTPTAPDRLLVVKWDDETGASELAAIKTDGKPGAYVDFNTNDYPNIWLVEADSISDLDEVAKQQGQYPPDYEGNPSRQQNPSPVSSRQSSITRRIGSV